MDRYPEIEIEPALLKETDLVLFSSEPYAFKQADIDAFRKNFPGVAPRMSLIDGEMTSWFGSRAIEGLRYLHDFAEQEISEGIAHFLLNSSFGFRRHQLVLGL